MVANTVTELSRIEKELPLYKSLSDLCDKAGSLVDRKDYLFVDVDGLSFPLPVVTMGSSNPKAPAIGIFGGVHGVERIGAEVVMAYLNSLISGLMWSPLLKKQLKNLHLVFMPLVNPGGYFKSTRCNPNGVDLMRNAPIDAEDEVNFLVGGHRISPRLPWYRGKQDDPMQPEAQALCDIVERHLLNRPFSIALDCHSGYGAKDYIWFPYAGSRKPFPHAAEMFAMKSIFDSTYPNHTYYQIEPQSLHYSTHGDLWDYMYEKSEKSQGIFLPLTLEMGSWAWIRKNPRLLFRFSNFFNPVLPHRHNRILRRHLLLLDFLTRATQGYKRWLPKKSRREKVAIKANKLWYG